MTQPAAGSAPDAVPFAVVHLIENADVPAFRAWAAGLGAVGGAIAAADTYHQVGPGQPSSDQAVPNPAELAAFTEPGEEGTTIRCVAIYADVPSDALRGVIISRLGRLWASSGAGQAIGADDGEMALHVRISDSEPTSDGDGPVAMPHVPWVVTDGG